MEVDGRGIEEGIMKRGEIKEMGEFVCVVKEVFFVVIDHKIGINSL